MAEPCRWADVSKTNSWLILFLFYLRIQEALSVVLNTDSISKTFIEWRLQTDLNDEHWACIHRLNPKNKTLRKYLGWKEMGVLRLTNLELWWHAAKSNFSTRFELGLRGCRCRQQHYRYCLLRLSLNHSSQVFHRVIYCIIAIAEPPPYIQRIMEMQRGGGRIRERWWGDVWSQYVSIPMSMLVIWIIFKDPR